MNYEIYKSKLLNLIKERNWILPTLLILIISQFISIVFLFCKKERIILIPPIVSQPMWIDDYAVSQTYLQQMGLFLGQMLLSNSSQSVKVKMDTILRYVHPSAYTTLRQYLIGEEEHLKKQEGSYHFHIHSINIDQKKYSVLLTGDRESYVGGKRIDFARESYLLTFKFNNGKFLLMSCQMQAKT